MLDPFKPYSTFSDILECKEKLLRLANIRKLCVTGNSLRNSGQPSANQRSLTGDTRLQAPEPPKAPPTNQPPMTDKQKQALWAAAMSDVAGEFTASLIHLPPAERKIVSRRAAALSSCANQLLSGGVPPRPRPGDLTAPPA
jgi:hypothetical protein